ncbi:hypothetical protein D3C80_1826150 [compost metagenome]
MPATIQSGAWPPPTSEMHGQTRYPPPRPDRRPAERPGADAAVQHRYATPQRASGGEALGDDAERHAALPVDPGP